jgi:hypothetical protein
MDGFRADRLYELVYTAKDPLVLGVGLAATRDIVSFFRHAKADASGTPNPVAGVVEHTIARRGSNGPATGPSGPKTAPQTDAVTARQVLSFAQHRGGALLDAHCDIL